MSTTTPGEKRTTTRPEPARKFWRRSAPQPASHPIYDNLLWRLQARREDASTLTIGVSALTPRGGATTIATGLAVRAAHQQADRVLLIDAHGSRGGLLDTFRIAPGPGLSELLTGAIPLREYEPAHLMDNLDLINSGQGTPTGSLRLRDHMVEEVLTELSHRYSMIVVDLPPAGELKSATALAKHLTGVILVVCSESIKRLDAQRAVRQLYQDGISLWGTVLNRQRDYVPGWLKALL